MLTKSFAKYRRFWILPEDQAKYSHLDYSIYKGRIYSDKAPGPSLLAVPIYWLAQLASFTQSFFVQNTMNEQEVDDLAKLLIVVALLIFHAATVIRTYDLCRLLGFDHIPSFVTSLVLAFASIWYPYTPTFFSHAIVGSLLIHAIFYLFRSKTFAWAKKDLLAAGLFSSLAVSSEYAVLFLLPCIILYILLPIQLSEFWIKEKISQVELFGLPVVITGILIGLYHFICFGNPLSTPYTYSYVFAKYQHFLNPIDDGLNVLLFSSSHGLFYFMPVALLGLISLPTLYRKFPAETSLIFSMFLIILLWISKFFKPDGGLAWSARHLVAVTPLLVIPLAAGLQSRKKSFLFLFCVFGLLSLIFNASAAWIRLWPTGGEGMTNPLFGSEGEMGHLERFFSWVSVEISSFNPFDWLVFAPSGPQSTLYRKYSTIFWVILYLAIFSNPFFPVLPWENGKDSKKLLSRALSSMDGLHASLGYGLIVISFLLAHITFLGVNLSTKPGAEDLYKLHDSDVAFLILTLLSWSFIVLNEIRGSGWLDFDLRLHQESQYIYFQLLCNYSLIVLVFLAEPSLEDSWLLILLIIGLITSLAYYLVIINRKIALNGLIVLGLVFLLVIWKIPLMAILLMSFFHIIFTPKHISNQAAENRLFFQWRETLSNSFEPTLIGALLSGFAFAKEYFAIESIPALYLIMVLALCLIEATIRGSLLLLDHYQILNASRDSNLSRFLLQFFDINLLAIVMLLLVALLELGIASPLNLVPIFSFSQVIAVAFWVSLIMVSMIAASDYIKANESIQF
ncbi:MAG: hypothetical protein ACFFGZ_08350 [Candidatus Thorarchaeota archaeon]